MNERDSEAVAAMLRGRGYRIVQTEDDCDIMLLNTCSVRDAAEQKALGKAGYVAQRKKRNPDFVLGILGCMAQNHKRQVFERAPFVDLVVGPGQLHQVPRLVREVQDGASQLMEVSLGRKEGPRAAIERRRETRGMQAIQSGDWPFRKEPIEVQWPA